MRIRKRFKIRLYNNVVYYMLISYNLTITRIWNGLLKTYEKDKLSD